MGDLLERTAALVDIASVSRNEKQIADVVEDALRSVARLEVVRVENNVVARTQLGRAKRILLGGHLDTVPPSGNERARVEGDRCFGCGATDMKGGIAVLLEMAREVDDAPCDVTFLFYEREEIARAESGLLMLDQKRPDLLGCDVAVLLEPTGGVVEAGCQGVLRAAIEVAGRRAHTARPWMGVNAIHRLGRVIDRVDTFTGRQPLIDGCEYRETMQVVSVSGGVATNVVPDHAQVEISLRFAPDREVEQVTQELMTYLEPCVDITLGDTIKVVDAAPAALPALSTPFLRALVSATKTAPRAKLGWTDVAFFAQRGIPATNFGPGDPELAHTADEFVTRHDLEFVYDVLRLVIDTAAAEDNRAV